MQHNWVVLAYNFNVVILVLIIKESSISANSAYHFYYSFILVITLHYHFIPALTEYQPQVYSTLLFSPATQTCSQKEKMDWNSSMNCSMLHVAPIAIPMELWSLPLFRFIESRHSL
jgi:hypothetical protein